MKLLNGGTGASSMGSLYSEGHRLYSLLYNSDLEHRLLFSLYIRTQLYHDNSMVLQTEEED